MFEAVVLTLALLFGGYEHLQKKQAEARAEEYKAALDVSEASVKTMVNANESNRAVIEELERNLTECSKARERDIIKVNNFKESNRVFQAAIDNFERNSRDLDWGTCRVPDGIDIQTILRDYNGN